MWLGVIFDGGGAVYGWVSRAPNSGIFSVDTYRGVAHRFGTQAEALSAASTLLRRLIGWDMATDLYTAGVEPLGDAV